MTILYLTQNLKWKIDSTHGHSACTRPLLLLYKGSGAKCHCYNTYVGVGKSGCKVKDYSQGSTREDNVPCYSMVKVEANGREYTDYEEVVTDTKKSTTQSDKSKATKEIKLHPTHPSGVFSLLLLML